MLFIAEFGDGATSQIVANDLHDAKMTALSTFKDKLVLLVRKAGLQEMMTQRQSPSREEGLAGLTD
jgi:hypothetical protein